MPVAFQETIWADAPLKVTVPGLDPNPVPMIVTCVPGCPDVGLTDVIVGVAQATDASRTHAKLNPSCDRPEMTFLLVSPNREARTAFFNISEMPVELPWPVNLYEIYFGNLRLDPAALLKISRGW